MSKIVIIFAQNNDSSIYFSHTSIKAYKKSKIAGLILPLCDIKVVN